MERRNWTLHHAMPHNHCSKKRGGQRGVKGLYGKKLRVGEEESCGLKTVNITDTLGSFRGATRDVGKSCRRGGGGGNSFGRGAGTSENVLQKAARPKNASIEVKAEKEHD